jgi:serine/threonine protein phosphatase PrpC|tara:strand:- start:238 stop:480 length:243 start_codon:yes stop_codon:yes gene_type:complete
MPNPMHFDSDWDYYDACLSPEDKIVQALSDGENDLLTQQYIDWMIKQRPQAVAQLLIDTAEASKYLDDFAKIKIREDAEP